MSWKSECRYMPAPIRVDIEIEGTQPLYQCYAEVDRSHFASNRNDCEGQGKLENLLGYDLVH